MGLALAPCVLQRGLGGFSERLKDRRHQIAEEVLERLGWGKAELGSPGSPSLLPSLPMALIRVHQQEKLTGKGDQ